MLKKLFLTILLTGSSVLAQNSANDRPNIIIIMADDMGFSDLGVTGSEIETPNIDKLANNGVLFTNFYNTGRCCPSRASLLTGQEPWDAGMGGMVGYRETPEYQGYLSDDSVTIAEVLNDNGYQSFMSGKWHVGDHKREMWPDYRGFKDFYGVPKGGGLYFSPSKHYDRDVYKNGEQVQTDSTWYSTDAFTDSAIEYISKDKKEDKPFFMYLAYIAPHYPLQAKKEDIKKYKNKYDKGYDYIRKERFKKQLELGVIPKGYKLTEAEHPEWADVENKEEESRKMEVYAAMVDCMDQNIGRLIQTLKNEGIYDNTIVFFLSDNGGCAETFNKTPDVEIGHRNSNVTYGDWYNVSNTPYRRFKTRVHEGGIISPLIVHWPKGISKKGVITDQPGHIADLMPTCLNITNTNYPESYKGIELDPIDGSSLMPIINGGEQDKNRVFHWEHGGNRAVRKSNWKLVSEQKRKWELYDLSNDPFESNNLASQKPELVEELKSNYKTWAVEHGVR